jgi:hypothetical protein
MDGAVVPFFDAVMGRIDRSSIEFQNFPTISSISIETF